MQVFRFKIKKIHLFIAGAGIVLVLGLFAVLLSTQAAPAQPFPFPHDVHVQNGVSCLYCHPGANRGVTAGLPTRQKCLGCHNNINATTPALQEFAKYAQDNAEFTWVPVAILPEFVFFNHQPHINARVDCANCHGDVSKMKAAEPQKYMDMGYCLSCHKHQKPDQFIALSDCATCHR